MTYMTTGDTNVLHKNKDEIFALQEHHVPTDVIELMRAMWKEAPIKIKISNFNQVTRSAPASTSNGLLRRNILNATLFIIMLDSILCRIPENTRRTFEIVSFGHADDVVFHSNATEEGKAQLLKMKELSRLAGLKLSKPKTKKLWIQETLK